MKFNYKIGTYLGAPIYFNLFTLLAIPIFWSSGGFLSSIISGTTCIGLLFLHECGHAWFAKKYRHNLIKINIYPLHGSCTFQHDSQFELETLIYAGGLLVQLIIFIGSYLAFNGLVALGLKNIAYFLEPIGKVLIQINLVLFIFNALPIPGLDGFILWKRFINFTKFNIITIWNKTLKFIRYKKVKSPEKIILKAIKQAQKESKK